MRLRDLLLVAVLTTSPYQAYAQEEQDCSFQPDAEITEAEILGTTKVSDTIQKLPDDPETEYCFSHQSLIDTRLADVMQDIRQILDGIRPLKGENEVLLANETASFVTLDIEDFLNTLKMPENHSRKENLDILREKHMKSLPSDLERSARFLDKYKNQIAPLLNEDMGYSEEDTLSTTVLVEGLVLMLRDYKTELQSAAPSTKHAAALETPRLEP